MRLRPRWAQREVGGLLAKAPAAAAVAGAREEGEGEARRAAGAGGVRHISVMMAAAPAARRRKDWRGLTSLL